MSVYLQQWEKEGLNLHFGAQFAVVFEVSLSCPELYGIVGFFSVSFSLMEVRRLEIFAVEDSPRRIKFILPGLKTLVSFLSFNLSFIPFSFCKHFRFLPTHQVLLFIMTFILSYELVNQVLLDVHLLKIMSMSIVYNQTQRVPDN